MLYRKLGKTGVDVSILGFGCMRLPVIDGQSDQIDYDLATEMLHYAIDNGVNYVDTAYFYHAAQMGQMGESEPFVGEALSGGWRERVNLATKMPLGFCRECGDMDRLLAEQLERLRTDYLDFYLLHGLSGAIVGPHEGARRHRVPRAAPSPTAASASRRSPSTARPPTSCASATSTTAGRSARSSTTTWTPSSRPATPGCATPPRRAWASW